VLIVDDDRWTTRALDMVLSGFEDFTILPPVHSGEDAVHSYRSNDPDVVLMDINMPGVMNGSTRQTGFAAWTRTPQ
jgi:DNA-binding NarL/FixJ family response regulator